MENDLQVQSVGRGLRWVEDLKFAALAFSREVAKLSCCSG
jgi:hypothetical protein